jgi:hypothetical protein
VIPATSLRDRPWLLALPALVFAITFLEWYATGNLIPGRAGLRGLGLCLLGIGLGTWIASFGLRHLIYGRRAQGEVVEVGGGLPPVALVRYRTGGGAHFFSTNLLTTPDVGDEVPVSYLPGDDPAGALAWLRWPSFGIGLVIAGVAIWLYALTL